MAPHVDLMHGRCWPPSKPIDCATKPAVDALTLDLIDGTSPNANAQRISRVGIQFDIRIARIVADLQITTHSKDHVDCSVRLPK